MNYQLIFRLETKAYILPDNCLYTPKKSLSLQLQNLMCNKKTNAKFGISTQMLYKKVMSYPRLKQKVFIVDLCYSARKAQIFVEQVYS